jgi:NitT/TauT family transport system permease protein
MSIRRPGQRRPPVAPVVSEDFRPDVRPTAGALLLEVLPPVLTAAGLLLAWWLVVAIARPPVFILPSPEAVAARLLRDPGFFVANTGVTVFEALLGLLVGAGVAFALGVAMAHSRLLERAVLPLAILAKVTPIVTIAPLFLIWFGFGLLPKVLVAALITFFPTLINTVTGLRSVDSNMLDVLNSVSASRAQVFWRLRMPNAMPFLFAALKVSIPLSLIGAVVGEWVGAEQGIGNAIMRAHANLDMPTLFAGIVCLAVAGVAMSGLVAVLERAALHWHSSESGGSL